MSAFVPPQLTVQASTQSTDPPVSKERYLINAKTKERLFELMELTPTSIVADIGATASAVTFVDGKKIKGSTEGGEISDTRSVLARVPQGKVFAVNIDLEELKKIRGEIEDVRKSGPPLGELVTVHNSAQKTIFGESIAGGPTLEPGSVDVVLFSMVLHHIKPEVLQSVLESAQIALKPGGKIVILDKVVHGQKDRSVCEDNFQEVNHCSNPSKVLGLLYDLKFENNKYEKVSSVFYAPTNIKEKKFDQWILVASKPN